MERENLLTSLLEEVDKMKKDTTRQNNELAEYSATGYNEAISEIKSIIKKHINERQ